MSDTFVITRLCRDCVDGGCVAVCPVECIYQHDGGEPLPNQLFIHPEECISCGLCEPACPWEAIVSSDRVPLEWQSDIELNALTARRSEEFSVPVSRLRDRAKPAVHPDAIIANRLKWSTRAA